MRLTPQLRDRCKRFGSRVIGLYRRLPKQHEDVRVIGHQLLRAGTSVAAHAREASRARSDAEFCSKIEGLLQEADESQLWLEYLQEDCGIASEVTQPPWKEADELISIFVTICDRIRGASREPRVEKVKS